MIPIQHTIPNMFLIPYCRMWKTNKGNFWCELSNGWRLILYQSPINPLEWTLSLGHGDFLQTFSHLREVRDENDIPFLDGRNGFCTITIFKNPKGIAEPVTVYWGTSTPKHLHPHDSTFMGLFSDDD